VDDHCRGEARDALPTIALIALDGGRGACHLESVRQEGSRLTTLATLAGAYLGSKLLKERLTPERIAGAACIVLGVVSLSFAN
jgi:hypothetical protein